MFLGVYVDDIDDIPNLESYNICDAENMDKITESDYKNRIKVKCKLLRKLPKCGCGLWKSVFTLPI